MSKEKRIAWGLLAALFAVNYLETQMESWILGGVPELGYRVAHAFQQIEGGRLFLGHEASHELAVYGYSLSYFVLFPLLALGLAVVFTLRRDDRPMRLLARALAIDYAVTLPFYLFFPVPERWAYPGSGAMLLSDRWSSALIEGLRPISGLDNCFPSFHVSMSVVLIGLAILTRVRLRAAFAALGTTVILATFVLGIHWLPDIVAGVAVGVLSVALALRLEAGRTAEPAAVPAPA